MHKKIGMSPPYCPDTVQILPHVLVVSILYMPPIISYLLIQSL